MKHFTAILSTLAMVTAATQSNATIFPGAGCKVSNLVAFTEADGQVDATRGLILYTGSGSPLPVACGLSRHSESLTGSIYFRVYNHDSSISCTFSSVSGGGESFDYETTTTFTTGVSSQTVSTSGLTVYTTGSYTAECLLGHNDTLYSIRYQD